MDGALDVMCGFELDLQVCRGDGADRCLNSIVGTGEGKGDVSIPTTAFCMLAYIPADQTT